VLKRKICIKKYILSALFKISKQTLPLAASADPAQMEPVLFGAKAFEQNSPLNKPAGVSAIRMAVTPGQ
jgi:hypothetical protein